MSEDPLPAPRESRRYFAAVLSVALIALSVAVFLSDRRARVPVVATAAKYAFDIRRPLETEMIGFAPSADFGAQVIVYGSISDALGTVRLKGLDQVERDAWLDVPTKLDDELHDAIELSLDSISARPGWPLHRYLLGKAAYTKDRRTLETVIVPGRWLVPLRSAARSAPGEDSVAQTLAAVTLEAWSTISVDEQKRAGEVFRRAFLDPSFVSKAWAVSADAIGADAAATAVPESAGSLIIAARAASSIGEAKVAAALYRRWERAEWNEREADLAEMRKRTDRGDWIGLVSAAGTFASRHSASDFDTPQSRAQLEEVLELWPRDNVESWSGARRAEIVRFFLAGRMKGVDGTVLAGAASSLSGVPFPTQARLYLAAGLVEIAEELAKGSMTGGSFEWTDYYVDLARYHLARKQRDKALEAFRRIAPAARGECNAALVGAALEEGAAPASLPVAVTAQDGSIVPESWSANGLLSLCVDPRAMAAHVLVVDIATEGDALVEWGWNDARSATVSSTNGAVSIRTPMSGMEGRTVFFARPALGGKIVNRSARVE